MPEDWEAELDRYVKDFYRKCAVFHGETDPEVFDMIERGELTYIAVVTD